MQYNVAPSWEPAVSHPPVGLEKLEGGRGGAITLRLLEDPYVDVSPASLQARALTYLRNGIFQGNIFKALR